MCSGFDPTDLRHRKKGKQPRYTKFDDDGVPTHDHAGSTLTNSERIECEKIMKEAVEKFRGENGEEISVITESKKGERMIEDPRLMFRGLVMG